MDRLSGKPSLAMRATTRDFYALLWVPGIIAMIVGVDLLFCRHRIRERLIVNIGIVLVFAVSCFRFLTKPWARRRN